MAEDDSDEVKTFFFFFENNDSNFRFTPQIQFILYFQQKSEEELKRKFIRDIGVAWCWVQSHHELFHGEVTDPEFLQMDEEKQSNIIKDYLKERLRKQGMPVCLSLTIARIWKHSY